MSHFNNALAGKAVSIRERRLTQYVLLPLTKRAMNHGRAGGRWVRQEDGVIMTRSFLAIIGLALGAITLNADELNVKEGENTVPLMDGKPYLHVVHEGKSIKVERVQDPDYQLKGYFSKTIRSCPPFCIRPMKVVENVDTVGEIEVFEFMEGPMRDDKGLLIDARTVEWYKRGTIPGSLNYPFTTLSKDGDEAEMAEALKAFGVKRRGDVNVIQRKLEDMGFFDGDLKSESWDFSAAKELVIWCNGPSCGQSPRAIHGLLDVGYPAEKLKYYRGGMQMWQLWGLTTIIPEQ